MSHFSLPKGKWKMESEKWKAEGPLTQVVIGAIRVIRG
jgi:hypothetical protein